ncbi:MAG: exodeoxyribonuclease I, partial [Aestuariibacter sp.]|nr:exodeoxyribonuclease I [Aestuariibacter sp.]
LARPDILLHVSGMFPAEQGCLAPIFPLLAHPSNANEIICFNLRFNPEALLQLDADQIQKKLYTRSLDLADGEQRIPLKGVHLNKSPALAPISTLNAQQAEKWQINWDEINHHRDLLLSDPGLCERLQQAYGIEQVYDSADADTALYEGFIGNDDRLRCNQLLASSPEQLAGWTEDCFHDKRLNTLLFRYRARNFPETLTDEESQRWQGYCHSRLIDGDFGAGLTAEQFQQQLLTLAQREQGEREQRLLDQLSEWAQGMFS